VHPRFFAPEAQASGELVTLPQEEAEHLTRVLRLGAGAAIRVFNGSGDEFESVVEAASKEAVQVRLGKPRDPAPEAHLQITLAQAVLKGDKMDDVVRDAVMLGASAIRPLLSERAEIRAATVVRARRVERWQKIAIASAKQCGRAVVPPVDAPRSLAAVLSDPPNGARIMFVEPGAAVTPSRIQDLAVPAEATLIVGPEGGWTDHEVRTASQAGASLVTLGGLTLRADAMPVVALTAIKTVWEDF
jgi:16S rRNA (uracil1498-N3)-methyltransferase